MPRLTNRPAVVNVTSGPGGINALNGVFGAYVDSIPMVVVSGQVKRETLVGTYDLPLRQLGDQEVDIVSDGSAGLQGRDTAGEPGGHSLHRRAGALAGHSGSPGARLDRCADRRPSCTRRSGRPAAHSTHSKTVWVRCHPQSGTHCMVQH